MPTQVKTVPALVVECGGDRQVHGLGSVPLTVGRSSGADICILHAQISRIQAVICPVEEGCYQILDGDGQERHSRNGTFVNWEPVDQKRLTPGDVICFGSPTAMAYFCWLDPKELELQDQLLSIKTQIEARLTDAVETLSESEDDTP